MIDWKHDHILHLGGKTEKPCYPGDEIQKWRKKIEPWLSAVFQSEHLSLLLGNGFTTAIADDADGKSVSMEKVNFASPHKEKIDTYAKEIAKKAGRNTINIEDQISTAFSLLSGLQILKNPEASNLKKVINNVLGEFVESILQTEESIRNGLDESSSSDKVSARDILISFLMSFASRTATRERLHVFTTNYDRLIELGCDLAGLRIVDRFVGTIEPEFRSSRLHIDMHYTPPGIKEEPRHLEGVVRLTKLHGSLDWRYKQSRLYRAAVPFGAENKHSFLPKNPHQSVIIYPNPIKDMETITYPYSDLFRDFSYTICQSNSVIVTYGYGYGDSHVNRVIADMLTIPSSHLVIIAWSEKPHERIASFVEKMGRPQQLTLLLGKHFGDIDNLVQHYLPRPSIDPLTIRMAELVERRRNDSDGKQENNIEDENGADS